jgi:hypothetical protein
MMIIPRAVGMSAYRPYQVMVYRPPLDSGLEAVYYSLKDDKIGTSWLFLYMSASIQITRRPSYCSAKGDLKLTDG